MIKYTKAGYKQLLLKGVALQLFREYKVKVKDGDIYTKDMDFASERFRHWGSVDDFLNSGLFSKLKGVWRD